MTIHHIPRKNGQGVWCYAEKGASHKHRHHGNKHNRQNQKKYPTLVFLHGIGINKDSWSPIIRKIPAYYHSIVVDMPGKKNFFSKVIEDILFNHSFCFRSW